DPANPCYVQTVRGKGYVFVPDASATPLTDPLAGETSETDERAELAAAEPATGR
ncbi:MAG: hypothetical protein QOH33_877, partial [Paraburkholderia sp.]|nr:hypothetical protein [Paraburkholderia sp.]